MAALVITGLFLFFCLLQSASAEPQRQPITAHTGQTVTLSCRAPNNVIITAVEWIRSHPDKRIFFQRDGHLVTADQDPSYVNRVQLKDDKMKNGELSLILKNVTSKDGGTYECRYEERGGRRKRSDHSKLSTIVYLIVTDPQDKQITVHHGQTVTLPCEAPNVTIAVVEWVKLNLNRSHSDRQIFLKRDGHIVTADQDPSYMNRVHLKDDEMKNGELSLIVKNVTNNDGGIYECRYVEDGGRDLSANESEPIITILNVGGGDSRDGKHSESDKHREDGKDTEGGHLGVILPVSLIAALVAAVGLVGFMIYKKLKGRSENNLDRCVDDVQQLQENENSQNISDTHVKTELK